MSKYANQSLIFVFSYACVKVDVYNKMYDKKDIQSILQHCTKQIYIDKSYVDYSSTKYQKTFMTEDGWNMLCDLVYKTEFGEKCSIYQNTVLFESYTLMILCYLYQLLEDLGYDCSYIHLEIQANTTFMVQIFSDRTHSYNSYKGKWQLW